MSAAHSSSAFQQRVRNGQPLGGCVAEGTGPVSTIGSIGSSRPGVAENRARVYGCRARSVTSVGRGLLDDPAEVHGDHPVAHPPHGLDVVGDEHQGQTQAFLAGPGAG